jgi:hypothetical protein
MARQPKGLRVKWCENVATYENRHGAGMHVIKQAVEDGWFVMVWISGQWKALMDLRFAREKDALRAAQALTLAGLNSVTALQKADPLTVRQIACEALQW